MGTLTGYTSEQMRAVPAMDSVSLTTYQGQSIEALVQQINGLAVDLLTPTGTRALSPNQSVTATLQGSFGHVGEIDTLVALRARLNRTEP